MKRKSKVSPGIFLDTILFNEFDNKLVSLNDHSVDLRLKHQLQIRKQSIDQRFNECTVDFVKTLLTEQISGQLYEVINPIALDRFDSVKLKDSTRFWLPKNLKDAYPGNGGTDCEAGMHIQFEFDLKSGHISDVNPTSALRQDQADATETVNDVTAGSLIIRDLAYFSTAVLEQVSRRNAYFITRLQPTVNVYELKQGRYEILDINSLYKKMQQQQISQIELSVFAGGKHKVPVRLFVETLPDEVINERLRKAKQQAAKKGSQPSEKYKVYKMVNLFITNVPTDWLVADHIRTLYRLRWQIELRFKCWKSLCQVHAIKKMKLHRFETYLYASLLHILINWEIAVNMVSIAWHRMGKLLSIYKYFKALRQSEQWLREALFSRGKKLALYLKLLFDSVINLQLEKRKNHLGLEEILRLNLEVKQPICNFTTGSLNKKPNESKLQKVFVRPQKKSMQYE